MLVASIMAVVVLGQPREAGRINEPAALVSQLGAPRFAEREAAALALERLGAQPRCQLCTLRAQLAIRRSGCAPPGSRKRSKSRF